MLEGSSRQSRYRLGLIADPGILGMRHGVGVISTELGCTEKRGWYGPDVPYLISGLVPTKHEVSAVNTRVALVWL